MASCGFIKANGEPCRGTATGPHGLCWAHAPENAAQRRRMASKAARSKPHREIKDLKKQLEDLAAGVLDETVERANAAVVNQILNTQARLIELERKIREQEELEARIQQLEEMQEQKGGSRWRA